MRNAQREPGRMTLLRRIGLLMGRQVLPPARLVPRRLIASPTDKRLTGHGSAIIRGRSGSGQARRSCPLGRNPAGCAGVFGDAAGNRGRRRGCRMTPPDFLSVTPACCSAPQTGDGRSSQDGVLPLDLANSGRLHRRGAFPLSFWPCDAGLTFMGTQRTPPPITLGQISFPGGRVEANDLSPGTPPFRETIGGRLVARARGPSVFCLSPSVAGRGFRVRRNAVVGPRAFWFSG